MTLTPDRLKELIEKSRAELLARQNAPTVEKEAEKSAEQIVIERAEMTAAMDAFTWNEQQLEACGMVRKGKSFCFIGAAGTGKTTTEKEMCRIAEEEDLVAPLEISTKYLKAGSPGILITSYTRRAVRNSRRVVPENLKGNCLTLHKVLEFEPIFYEVWDEEAQEMRKTMRFEPQRNRSNPLPRNLKLVFIDEASMPSVDLFKQFHDALPDPSAVQIVFVGDLNQLPPVYGQAILGFKLLELPTVELKKIYRQALESPIIALAHKIKNGEKVPVTGQEVIETSQGKVTIHPWKKAISDFDAAVVAGKFIKKLIESGNYDEEEDIFLCPQEKTKNLAFGTNEFNKVIAQTLGERRKDENGNPAPAMVHEVVAGYEKHYLAVGDRILVGREDAIITKISKNGKYWGKRYQPASIHLDRWGNYTSKPVDAEESEDFDMDKYLDSFELSTAQSDEERKQEASHLIDVELLDSGLKETLTTAGEINATQFAYALTVHKAQGSEWNRVFFLTHQSHVVMWSRELLYTAITRARKELYLIVEPDRGSKSGTLTKAAMSPRIKGDTLEEKAEHFKGKQGEYLDKMSKGEDEEREAPRAGTYKGSVKDTPPTPPAPTKPPVKLLRLCELVPELFKKEAQRELDGCWTRAEMIWGAGKIGTKPILDYNLQRSHIIGLASYGDNKIYLNPLWCILADENEFLRKEMLEDTIPHEVAHFINQHYSYPKGKGHDGGWVMAAKLLGMKNPKEGSSEFPDWGHQYKDLIAKKQQELSVEKDGVQVVTADDTSILTNCEA